MPDPIPVHPSNAEQAEYWNSAGGKRWTEYQEVLDRALAGFEPTLLEGSGVRPGMRVLDVGCGCGHTSLAFADRVGDGGSVLGVDLSHEMLERARARAAGRTNVRFVAADAAQLTVDRLFDRIVSRFGVMFFGDPVGAFRHLRSLLRPEGRLAFVCWQAHAVNPWGQLTVAAVRRALPDLPPSPTTGPGPFAFADPERVKDVLAAAGFGAVRIEPFDAEVVLSATGLTAAVEFGLYAGPAARLIGGADAAGIARAREELALALAPLVNEGRVALPGRSWIVTSG